MRKSCSSGIADFIARGGAHELVQHHQDWLLLRAATHKEENAFDHMTKKLYSFLYTGASRYTHTFYTHMHSCTSHILSHSVAKEVNVMELRAKQSCKHVHKFRYQEWVLLHLQFIYNLQWLWSTIYPMNKHHVDCPNNREWKKSELKRNLSLSPEGIKILPPTQALRSK